MLLFHKRIQYGTACLGVLILAVLITFYSREIGSGVQKGIALCGELVVPSLFVFFCFCEWVSLSGIGKAVSFFFAPLYRLLMGDLAKGGISLFLCLLGGYPMGASSLASSDFLTSQERKRLALWIFCPSPAFVIVGVGQGMLRSAKTGVILWSACVISCLCSGCILSRIPLAKETDVRFSFVSIYKTVSLVEAVSSATIKMLQICGLVIFFSALWSCYDLLPFPNWLKCYISGFGEVTSGCQYVIKNGASLPQIGAVLMFGGVAVHFQCRGLLKENSPRYIHFILVRLVQTLFCYGLLWLYSYFFPQTVSAMAFGGTPTVGQVSILPCVALLGTCGVFLCSLHQMKQFRSCQYEKSGIRS